MKTSFVATVVAAACLLLASCAMQPYSARDTRLSKGIVYDGAHALRLDVYAPQAANKAPVVVFLAGERWEYGDKSRYGAVGRALAARGFVTIIPNVRHYPAARYKGILGDCAEVLAWAWKSVSLYGGDPDQVVLMGYSSGAYDAMMLALNPQYLDAVGGKPSWLKGVIGVSGPYNFLPITAPDLRAIFGPPDQFEKTQPVFWANGGNPPLLLIASTGDRIANAQDTEELFNRVKRANGAVAKVMYQKLSHDDMLAVLGAASGHADVLKNVVEFIRGATSGSAAATQRPPPGASG